MSVTRRRASIIADYRCAGVEERAGQVDEKVIVGGFCSVQETGWRFGESA